MENDKMSVEQISKVKAALSAEGNDASNRLLSDDEMQQITGGQDFKLIENHIRYLLRGSTKIDANKSCDRLGVHKNRCSRTCEFRFDYWGYDVCILDYPDLFNYFNEGCPG